MGQRERGRQIETDGGRDGGREGESEREHVREGGQV